VRLALWLAAIARNCGKVNTDFKKNLSKGEKIKENHIKMKGSQEYTKAVSSGKN
jgi:hypothetical protein